MNFSQSAIFSVLASFGLLLINLFISIIEARVLGPEEIGRFQVYITTQTYIATICALGIGQSCIYFINALNVNERKVLSTSINSSIFLASLAFVALFIIIIFNNKIFGSDSLASICLFSLGTSAMIINNIFTPVLLAKMEVLKNQIIKYSTRTITLGVLLLCLLLRTGLDVGFLIGLTGITNVVSLILLYYYFKDRFSFRDGIDFSLLGRISLFGLKLSGNNIASITLSSIPVYFLTWFSIGDGLLDVGYYGRANSLLVIGTVISTTIGPLLYSKWSGLDEEKLKQQVRRISLIYIVINILITAFLAIAAPILIKLLYGPQYIASIVILQALSISVIANGIKEICYGVLSSQGQPTRILKNLLIGIILCALLNYIIIPKYGVVGCAVITSLISFVTAGMLVVDITRITRIEIKDFFSLPSKEEIYQLAKHLFKRA